MFNRPFYQILIAVMAVTLVTASKEDSSQAEIRRLPEGLRLGVATAAFQIEGGWNASGRHYYS